MEHAINKRLEQTVLKPAVKSVVDQTTLATTSMDPAFLVVLLDTKEKDARMVSKVLFLCRYITIRHIKFLYC